ncbi:MAG: glycosyltransferase family 2 protein [Saprospiraceae bacterium]|nr:glycosyltransferase family 2 protein [Saprospiraceae bacterium]
MLKNNKFQISIVIPCYNEEGNVKLIYDSVSSVLSEYNIEIVFVDDNSKDNTLNIIQNLADKDPHVKYVSFSRNFGHQSALRAGLEYASGDCVISMDGDMQHPPELLPQLIKKWEEGYDIVYTMRKDVENVSFFKRVTSSLFYKLINSLSDIEINEGSADFRLLDKRIVKILVNDITEYHLFYRGLISWIGYKQAGIEYIPNKRFSGKTKYSIGKMINFAIDGITSFSIKPLKLAILLGISLSVLSALYGIYALYMSIFTNETVKGWTSVLVSILFIGGVNMILLGIIGEYVGKLYIQSKKRPYFLVKETNIKN